MHRIIASVLSDPALAAAREAFKEVEVVDALAPFFPGEKLRRVNVRVLRHRKGRRALIAYTLYFGRPRGGAKRTVLLAKAYRGERASHVFDVLGQAHAAALASTSRFRTPAPIALLEDWGVVVFEKMDGFPVTTKSRTSDFACTGSAIAAFHAAQMHFEEFRKPEDELGDAATWIHEASKVSAKLPAAGEFVLRHLQRAVSSLESEQTRPLHRDFYPAQVLVGHGAPAFIDLDDAAMGGAAMDAGNFLAHLSMFPEPSRRRAGAAFINALRCNEALPQSNLRFYLVASLVRIAGVHAVRYGDTRLATRLIGVAERLVRESQSLSIPV